MTALLNCVLREVARPDPDGHRLPATGRLLRVHPAHPHPRDGNGRGGAGRFPSSVEVLTREGWRPLSLDGLVAVVGDELRAGTGVGNDALPGEIAHSRDVVAALAAARREAAPPDDPYLRSEQALLAGHRYHPAPKARGGREPDTWLRYAPEAYARFPLELLGVPEEMLVEEGDPAALDGLGPSPPDGYRLLPAHPWQLDLLGGLPGRGRGGAHGPVPGVVRLGRTAVAAVPTSSLRTVYLPEADVFCKFSLDVRITNDVRRLWLRDLRWLTAVDGVLRTVFDDLPGHLPRPSVLSDRGYRTADPGGPDGGEALAVVVRDGLRRHLRAGLTPLLAAGISEGYPGAPLDGLDRAGAVEWWQRYLDHLVPPVLHAYLRHGVVLECHLQNVLVGVDGATGTPGQVIFRDHEGVKLVADRHRDLLAGRDATGGPGVSAAYGWERLVYCLVVNHLTEIAGAVGERHAGLAGELWGRARAVVAACARDHDDPPELRALLAASHVPAKANLLLRWTGADGGAMRCVPVPNPLAPSHPDCFDRVSGVTHV
ncbi:IucA/IucC family C-terminal-domain containing protein [Nonomuraea sp. NPDC047897]|uniref:IucA/IucC family C-terminal-domain containing protein n=1 Tax=Nonomuraea sp. NPDC047897 TaxID=3364346 RepID=UPI00371BE014